MGASREGQGGRVRVGTAVVVGLAIGVPMVWYFGPRLSGSTEMYRARREPRQHLERVARGARDMVVMPEDPTTFDVSSFAFPASAPLAPADSACCRGKTTCAPDPTLWDHPTWRHFEFAVTEPTHYAYSFESSGTGTTARFTARAVPLCDSPLQGVRVEGRVVDDDGDYDVELSWHRE